MSRKVVTVEPDDSLAIVREIFLKTNFHHLPVIENRRLIGVISDRDLFQALSPKLGQISEKEVDRACLRKKAHQIMSRKPITLTSTDSLEAATQLFLDNQVSALPIVDEEKLVGILSWRDILKAHL